MNAKERCQVTFLLRPVSTPPRQDSSSRYRVSSAGSVDIEALSACGGAEILTQEVLPLGSGVVSQSPHRQKNIFLVRVKKDV